LLSIDFGLKAQKQNSPATGSFVVTRRSFLAGLTALTCFGELSSVGAADAAFNFSPFSFAVISDSHLANGMPDTLKLLQESQLFLQDAIKSINEQGVDFVLFAGDQVEGTGRDEAFWQLFIDIMSVLNCPWYFVLGESDVSGPPAVERMRTYGPDFKGKGLTSGNSYWSTDAMPGVHLIGLDTAKANSDTGDLNPAQLSWLKQDLSANKGKITIVVSHHPLLAPPPYDGGPPFEEYTVAQGASAREILGGSADVRLAISGHVPVNKIQRERNVWFVSCPPLDVYPCEFKLFHVSLQGITVETLSIRYDALVKKARKVMINSRLAFQYSDKNPESFLRITEGGDLDRSAFLPLAPGAVAQRLLKSKVKKAKEQKDGQKDDGAKNDQKADQKPDQKLDKKEKKQQQEKQQQEKSASEKVKKKKPDRAELRREKDNLNNKVEGDSTSSSSEYKPVELDLPPKTAPAPAPTPNSAPPAGQAAGSNFSPGPAPAPAFNPAPAAAPNSGTTTAPMPAPSATPKSLP